MASTYINHLKDYYDRVDRFPQRKNALTIGDSWFQYPLRFYPDLQTRICADAQFGRRANFLDDSIPGRDAKDVTRRIRQWRGIAEVLQARGRPFALILLSLGGNDVIGLDFKNHLTDGSGRSGANWPWNPQAPALIRRWLDLVALKQTFNRVADSYRMIVAMRDEFAPGATIISHTYAAVTPADRPYKFAGLRGGPWIWKYLDPLGLSATDQKRIVEWLLESFHNLLLSLAAQTHHFVVLDTRLELPDPAQWDNEIHPLGPGFVHLADRFWAPVIDPLL
jgi:hypothetical protein